jgi:predicted Fe-Mo cluster-binding NifX family protein
MIKINCNIQVDNDICYEKTEIVMIKRIAMPAINRQLSPHFGHCQYFAVYDVEDDKIINRFSSPAPPHETGSLPNWLVELEVTDVIAGGMGPKAVEIFNNHGINVYLGAQPIETDMVIEQFLAGTHDFTANLCDHHGDDHHHEHRHNHKY